MVLALVAVVLMACNSSAKASDLDAAQIARGRALYVQTCQQCHGDAATGTGRIPQAPPHSTAGHTWHHADGQIVDLVQGKLQYPGRIMPVFPNYSKQEVLDILAYLKSNWPQEQRDFQAEASRNWDEQH